jgi:hypothetical protein
MQVEISNVRGEGKQGDIHWEIPAVGIVLVHIPEHNHRSDYENLALVLEPWAERIEGVPTV